MSAALLIVLLGHLLPAAPPDHPQRVAAAPTPIRKQTGETGPPIDTLVVVPPELRGELTPWIRHRAAQGHRIALFTLCDRADQVQTAIRQVSGGGGLETVLLVGDAFDPAADQLAAEGTDCLTVPTEHVPAEINTAWGSEPRIATDHHYGDLDGDGIPELCVGRLPAGDADELRAMIRKTIEYERALSAGDWQRQIDLVAGVGGFGVIADAVLETAARTFVSKGIPDAYRTRITYASWRSPYCPDPRLFREEVINGINDGCLCWVYIGHGFRQGLDWVRVPIGAAPIFTLDDVSRLTAKPGRPIAVFLSCYGAAFDGPEDGLAERLLVEPGGPVAVIGGTRVTMPYGMTVLSQALMKEMFAEGPERPQTVGAVLKNAKLAVAAPDAAGRHPILNALARAISPNPDNLDGELREHVLMFHLLGDPLLRLPSPAAVDVTVPRSIQAGGQLHVACRSDVAGDCLVELVCARGQLTFEPEPRVQFDGTHDGMRALSKIYRKANDDRYLAKQLTVDSETFETILTVPESVQGACCVRVLIKGAGSIALGAATVYVDP